jgi:hypothetical protein
MKIYFKAGCKLLAISPFLCLCGVFVYCNLAPKIADRFRLPDYPFVPQCDEKHFVEITQNPLAKMRFIGDLDGDIQVIVIDDLNHDICFFKNIIHSGSSDEKHIAFTKLQTISSNQWREHLFIFSPENLDERIEDLMWFPDGTVLVFVTFSDCCRNDANTYINSMTPAGELAWRVDLGTRSIYKWGQLIWNEESEQIRYGHDEDEVLGKPVGQPFWCSLNRDGTNLDCQLVLADE